VIFDRSWYNRAGVERVMGFCTEKQAKEFLRVAPLVEKAIVQSGVILLKYWLEVHPDEQTRRLQDRIEDGRKLWKLSPMDIESYGRWKDYSRARDDMLAHTDTTWAPWYVIRSDDKRRAHLNLIAHLLRQVPYKKLKQPKIALPKRKDLDDYTQSKHRHALRRGALLSPAHARRESIRRQGDTTMLKTIATTLALALLALAPQARADVKEEQAELRERSQTILADLYKAQPAAKGAIQKAAGYATFSNFGMKIFLAGGGKGAGVAVDRKGKKTTYMKMVEVQAGLGSGSRSSP
jgi:hypothetical protein